MSNIVLRGYLELGFILSLASFFVVPKIMEVTRMVFDDTLSGNNEGMQYPNFMLPLAGVIRMVVGPYTHMVDLDVGEIFYNFRLS